MNKVILTFDGHHFSKGAFEFVRRLNELRPVLLSGIFLPEIVYPGAYGFTGKGMLEMPSLIPFLQEYDEEVLDENTRVFKALCESNGIEYRVHKCYGDFAMPQLKRETRYADVLVISSELFYRNTQDGEPDDYVDITLRHSECPVLILPEACDFPDNILLAYDGSESSVYAIKQFAYLFPELCSKSTLLVYAGGMDDELPDESYIKELAPRHFNDLAMMTFSTGSKDDFTDWMAARNKSLVVTGSYDRSAFSEFFRKSFAEDLIKSHRVPVFVAHK